MALLCDTPTIRDVIAFPKTGAGTDALFKSPSAVGAETLALYGLTTTTTTTTTTPVANANANDNTNTGASAPTDLAKDASSRSRSRSFESSTKSLKRASSSVSGSREGS